MLIRWQQTFMKSLRILLATASLSVLAACPAPAPVGNLASGQTLYGTHCVGCHGSDPKENQRKVANGTSSTAIDGAIARVGAMSFLANVLATQNKLDIAAYISSATK
jgi:mono/diheme cytochrome c family protein